MKKTCPVCEEEFLVPPTRPKQQYCCRECFVGRNRVDSEKRIDNFIEKLPDMTILDVFEGKLNKSTTDNRIFVTARGVRSLESPNVVYYVVAVEEE